MMGGLGTAVCLTYGYISVILRTRHETRGVSGDSGDALEGF